MLKYLDTKNPAVRGVLTYQRDTKTQRYQKHCRTRQTNVLYKGDAKKLKYQKHCRTRHTNVTRRY